MSQHEFRAVPGLAESARIIGGDSSGFSEIKEYRDMAKETKKISDLFGSRLAATRKTAGLTQEALAEQIGISRRALAYYETEADNPPTGDVLLRIAQALRVSVDQLLGTKTIHMPETPKNPRMMRKLEQVARLPKNDQRAVIRHIDALANAQRG